MALVEKNVESILSVTTIADFSSATETEIFVVPTGDVCYLTKALVECDGDVGANLAMTIGQNGAETDFVGTTNGDNLDADNDFILMAPVPSATPATLKKYAAATSIRFDVAVAGNAVAGKVILFGILRDA
jgi:hypothetical protein